MKIGWICVQKTGSTSIRDLFTKYLDKTNHIEFVSNMGGHAYCFETNDIFGFKWSHKFPSFDKDQYDKIYTVIRNPFDILISYYHHYSIFEDQCDRGWCGCNDYHQFSSWEEFLSKYLDQTFIWHMPRMKNSMFSFLYDKEWNLIIDKYFKLENILEINHFIRSLGINEDLPHTNISTKDSKQIYYTSKDIDKLNKIWSKDLKYFNYKYTDTGQSQKTQA